MKIYLVELIQTSPKWGKPIKHVRAASAKEARDKFSYMLNGESSRMRLRAHELKEDEEGDLWGKNEDCPECMEYCQELCRQRQSRASDLDLCALDSSNDFLFCPGITQKAEDALRDNF